MTLHTYADIVQRSEEWLQARCGIVTASVVGQLLTPTLKVADNDTSRGVTRALVAERLTGHVEETGMTADMWRGIEHEPYAREAYAKHTDQDVTEVGFMVEDRWGFKIGYSPDGLVNEGGLLEVKCPRAKTHLGTILADEVPAYYMAQVQTALLVSGRAWCDFVSFCAGMPLWHKRVLPDAAWHEAIVAAVAAFETRATEMADNYLRAVEGLPATERIYEVEMTL